MFSPASSYSLLLVLIFHLIQVRSLPCLVTPSLSKCSCWILFNLDLSVSEFLWFVTWSCQNWCMDFSKLLHGFVKVFKWICQSCSLYFSPFAKQNQAEFWPRFQRLLKLLLWTKGFYESKYSMPWVRCGFGNICLKYVHFHFHLLIPVSHLQFVHAIRLWNKWFERQLPKKNNVFH